jgi:hypothetical protein
VKRIIRVLLILGGFGLLFMAFGYATQMSWAINTWPWPDGRLSYLFVASIQAAIAAAMLRIGFSGEWPSIAAGALNLAVMMGGIAVFLYGYAGTVNLPRFIWLAVGAGLFALVSLYLFYRVLRQPIPAAWHRPTPRPVLVSYGIFTVTLVVVGLLLILRTPNIMPWPLKPETSVMIGWIFFGDAFYFLYAILRPQWAYARTQLWSFLAYDLVLIAPFVAHLTQVQPELRTSLILYLVVLLYSGSLAVYYLFIHPATRPLRVAVSN